MEEIRNLQGRLEAMEAGRQCDPEARDVNENEGEDQDEMEAPAPKSADIRMLRSVHGSIFIPKPELPIYDGILTLKTLIDWISELDKYFEYEEIEEEKKIKFVVTSLKGHATIWWERLQVDRRSKNKLVIKSWDIMLSKMKSKFLPKYYHLTLYKQVQNIKQREIIVRAYIEEFYKFNLRAGYVEDTPEKTTRYINGLRMEIQDEIGMLSPHTMEKAYQCALEVEEKILRKQNLGRGRGSTRGRG